MKMTKRDQILIAVIGVIAIVGGFFWFVVKPAKAELGTQHDALAAVQNESNDLKRHARPHGGLGPRARPSAPPSGSASRRPSPRAPRRRASWCSSSGSPTGRTSSSPRSRPTRYSDYGSIRGTEFEIRVTGRFFDVDDFLYRLHRQVAVDEKDRPIVGGRLFATTSVDLTLAAGHRGNGTERRAEGRRLVVAGTVKLVAFSSVPGGAAAGPTVAPTHRRRGPGHRTPTTTANPRSAPGHRHAELRRYPVIRRRHLAPFAACRGRGPDARRLRRGRWRRRIRRAERRLPLPDASLPVAAGVGAAESAAQAIAASAPRARSTRRVIGKTLPATTASGRPHDAFDQQVDADAAARPAGPGSAAQIPADDADQRRPARLDAGPGRRLRRRHRAGRPRPPTRTCRCRTRAPWRPTSTSPASRSWPARATRSRRTPSSSSSRRSGPRRSRSS